MPLHLCLETWAWVTARRRLLNGRYEWVPPPAKSRQSDGERGAPSAANRVVLQSEGTSLQKDGPVTDGRYHGSLYPSDFFPPFFLFVISLPNINVRSSIRYNEPGSEITSPQMSNFRSPHWRKCKHKSSKVYNFGDLVFEHCHFSSAKAVLQRQTLHSFITRSLVL